MCLGKKKTTTQNKKISPKTRKKTRNHIFKYIELLKIFDTWELSDVLSLLFVETHKAGSFFFINLQLISYFGSCSTWKHPGKNFLASGESFCNWLVLWMHRTEEDSTVFLFIFLKNLMRGCWCLIWLFLSFFFFFSLQIRWWILRAMFLIAISLLKETFMARWALSRFKWNYIHVHNAADIYLFICFYKKRFL